MLSVLEAGDEARHFYDLHLLPMPMPVDFGDGFPQTTQ